MYFLGRLIEQDVSSKSVLKLKDVYIVYMFTGPILSFLTAYGTH